MSTPEELLCSRKWRIMRGTWMLWGWVPFAWTAWVGYLIIGIKARSWKWVATAVGFFAFGLTSMILISAIQNAASDAVGHELVKGEATPEPWATYNVIVFLVLIAVWIGNAAVVQWFVNRKWLVWRAHHQAKSATPWYATATATPGAAVGSGVPPTQVSPAAAVDNALLVSEPAGLPAATSTAAPLLTPLAPATQQAPSRLAPPAPGTLYAPGTASAKSAPIDLNTASRDQLATLPGIDLAWADHIIATRSRVGGFTSPADLVTAASVQPHVFAGIRDRLVATPPAVPDPAIPADGRRLEF